MQKQKSQPCFDFIFNSKVFCLHFAKAEKHTLSSTRT